nr:hypothetical protein [Micromonospora sp. DSM 115978]
MTTDDLIESYLSDVARALPRRQRRDVVLELRTLLAEELAAKAEQADRAADETMTYELLRAFGRPAEVAARYQPGPVIIDAADTRRFVRLTVGGVLVIWLLGLLDAVLVAAETDPTPILVLQIWWAKAGLPVLWWPGLLVVCFGAAAWARRRWPNTPVWKPRPVDRDRINRTGLAAALVFFTVGTAVLVRPAIFLDVFAAVFLDGPAAPAAYHAFAYDDEFYSTRAPVLLPLMILHLTLFAVLIARGRWEPLTRRIDLGLNLAICAVLTWILLAGDIFQAQPTDELVKLVVVLIVLGALVDAAVKVRRALRRRDTRPVMRTRSG